MYETLLNDVVGAAVLPEYEISRSVLAVKSKPIRPFDRSKGFAGRPKTSVPTSLAIDAKLLMLAAAKSEMSRSFGFAVAAEQAFGLWIRYHPLLLLDGGELRLADPGIFARKDGSTTFDAGRIGEGLGHLFMSKRGYVFWDHLPTLLMAASTGHVMTHADRTKVAKAVVATAGKYPGEEPDFVCETAAGEVALLECKGSFVPFNQPYSANPTVLRGALSQLKGWSNFITPTPTKQFVVGAFLRHDGDNGNEPGMIAWVDPPGDRNPSTPLPRLPPDAIRRGHYGALLALLGFRSAGFDLRTRRKRSAREQRVLLMSIGKKSYVMATLGNGGFFRSNLAWNVYLDLLDEPRGTVFGLDADLFPAFTRALSNPSEALNVDATEARAVETENLTGNLLADRSFVGEIKGSGEFRLGTVTL